MALKTNKATTTECHSAKHANRWNTYAGSNRARQKMPRRFYLLLPKGNTGHFLGQQTAESTKREPTYRNETASNYVMDTKTATKTCTSANKDKLEYPQPEYTPVHQHKNNMARRMEATKTLLARLTTQVQQCTNNKEREAITKEITGDQPRGLKRGQSMINI